jgi:hypothetical protein
VRAAEEYPITAHFEAEYAQNSGIPCIPAVEEVFTMQ